ncbi:DotG/IcmE/VirB10 family protein [Parachitinimonas caeni]|uniref:DotG/IcmE/VirB10 family protein n=1 Tax=Parachitinimonas caeni TaxID=3031301 RepID=A0ABT7DWH7_9NEIS|nr:DotG/IcmE/VirB10 family protein [Parachitinimonas caeni]MDK2124416.1 DotG/IcmE/VirB10 family protein [Parachitinimonas caeni]
MSEAPAGNVRTQNVKAVFGSGIGRISLLVAGFIVVVFGYVAVSRLFGKPAPKAGETPNVELPAAPNIKTDPTKPVAASEVERRKQQGLEEAQAAQKENKSYQAEMLPAVKDDMGRFGKSDMGIDPAAQARWNEEMEAYRRRQQEVQKRAQEQIQTLIGTLGKPTTFSVAVYAPPKAETAAPTATDKAATSPAAGKVALAGGARKPMIRQGTILYATLDTAVNSDDMGVVLATLRGGEFDGAKMIGKVRLEQVGEAAMRIEFNAMSGARVNDGSIRVSAVALREEDGRQNVTDEVDGHYFSRYLSLFTAAALTGIGKAASVVSGSTTTTSTGTATTTTTTVDPFDTSRQARLAAGEVGTALGAEVKKQFSRPPTLSIPAGKGIGVLFVEDVNRPATDVAYNQGATP